jgi:hypothetical protein
MEQKSKLGCCLKTMLTLLRVLMITQSDITSHCVVKICVVAVVTMSTFDVDGCREKMGREIGGYKQR